MHTYTLVTFHQCHHETATRWHRLALGQCHCGLMGRPRTVFCAVRAESPQDAAQTLGATMLVLSSSRPNYPPSLDTATYYDFRPTEATYAIVSQAWSRLRSAQPPPPAAGEPQTVREAVRSLNSPIEAFGDAAYGSLMELASAENRSSLEAALRAALTNKKLRFFLMLVPEVPHIESMPPTAENAP